MNKLYQSLTAQYLASPTQFVQRVFNMYDNHMYSYNRIKDAVNILGIRSLDHDTARYNDVCIFFAYDGISSKMNICEFTTDPSNQNLLKPINSKGCAILKEGFYPNLWSLGFHKQRKDHPALVQTGKCIVYRDNNKDTKLDFKNEEEGIFGINCHRASLLTISEYIGLNSAGCQVFKRSNDLKTLIGLCENDVKLNRVKSFSYALFLEK